MSRVHADTRSLLQIFASSAIKIGAELPRHIAIIMDGNRRWAKSLGLKTKFGHETGILKVKEVVRWCMELKIQEITAYTFSIENFNRSQEQVEELMTLLHNMLVEIIDHLPSYLEDGVCIQFIGNWNLIPFKLKPNMARIMLETRDCKAIKINYAIAYTGRDGIRQSMQNIEKGITNGQLESQDVSEYLVEQGQNLIPMLPVDLLIRTGGDKRISDFMIWEATPAYLHFMDATWPEFNYWQFLDALVKYQVFKRSVPTEQSAADKLSPNGKERADKFLANIRETRWSSLARFAKTSHNPVDFPWKPKDTRFRSIVKNVLCFD